jgi:hypothetical protein
MIELIQQNKKLFTCYSSLSKLKEDYAKTKAVAITSAEMKQFVDKIQQYHEKVSDKVMRKLSNINTIWQDSSMVMTSPSITVGNSYSNANDFSRKTLFFHIISLGAQKNLTKPMMNLMKINLRC